MGIINEIIDDLKKREKERISQIKGASDEEIVDTIYKLKKDERLWNKVPSGNRNYLDSVLNAWEKDPEKAHNYVRGAIKHLIKAAPHQLGHIAQKIKPEYGKGATPSKEEMYKKVLETEIDLDSFTPKQLIEFAQYVEGNKELNSMPFYGSRSSVQSILRHYEKLKKEDLKEAENYAKEKAKSLRNIFGNQFIPNFFGKIARDYEKKRS